MDYATLTGWSWLAFSTGLGVFCVLAGLAILVAVYRGRRY